MSLKIVGAGFGRTGTLSMKFALEELGFSACYHMIEVRKNPSHPRLWSQAKNKGKTDWSALFAGYQASVDWPSCNFWREQAKEFPNNTEIDKWPNGIISYNRDFFYSFRGRSKKEN